MQACCFFILNGSYSLCVSLKSVSELQRRIESSNTDVLFDPTRSIGGESNCTLAAGDADQNVPPQHPQFHDLPHFYASFATADSSANSIVTRKSNRPKAKHSRKRAPLRQYPAWMYEILYLSADFLPRELLSSKVSHFCSKTFLSHSFSLTF